YVVGAAIPPSIQRERASLIDSSEAPGWRHMRMVQPHNNAMQLTGRPGTHLAVPAPPHISPNGDAQGARPSRPAADRERWTATESGNRNDVGIEQVRRLLRGQDRAASQQTFTRHRRKGRTPLSYARCGRCNRTKAGLSLRSTRAYLDGENR